MNDVCTTEVVHHAAVQAARAALPQQQAVEYLGDFFKVLGDITRLRILLALRTGELCVCDLGVTLELSASAVSHQLATLRRARLVTNRRDGKVVYYRLDDEHVEAVLDMAGVHLAER